MKDSFFSYEESVPDLTVDHEVGARWIRIGQEHADPAATRCKFTETQPVTARHSIRPAPGSCALPGPCQARLCQCSRRMRLAAPAGPSAADRALRAHAAPSGELSPCWRQSLCFSAYVGVCLLQRDQCQSRSRASHSLANVFQTRISGSWMCPSHTQPGSLNAMRCKEPVGAWVPLSDCAAPNALGADPLHSGASFLDGAPTGMAMRRGQSLRNAALSHLFASR